MGTHVIMSPHIKLSGDDPFASPFWAVQSSTEPNCEVHMHTCCKYHHSLSVPVMTNTVDLKVGDVLTIKAASAGGKGDKGGADMEGGGGEGVTEAGDGGGNGSKRKRPASADGSPKAGAKAKTKAKAKAKGAA